MLYFDYAAWEDPMRGSYYIFEVSANLSDAPTFLESLEFVECAQMWQVLQTNAALGANPELLVEHWFRSMVWSFICSSCEGEPDGGA